MRIGRARALGARVLAMASQGETDLYRADLSGPVVFVFGNEAHGLPDDIVAAADASVRVPQTGHAESLNLAAAATVCLFEWQRRRLRSAEALESIISSAAHDIRSPLTAMKGFGYALERRWEAMTEEQRTMMLRGIVHDADRMDTILRLLVDAARVVDGHLEVFREQVDVGDLVRGVAEAQRRDPDHPPVEWIGDIGTGVRRSGAAQDDVAVVHGIAGVVGPRRCDRRRRRDAGRDARAARVATGGRARATTRSRRSSCRGARGREPAARSGCSSREGSPKHRAAGAGGRVEGGRLGFHLELPAGPNVAGA